MGTKTHAVWDVYDKFRTADLNVRYYKKILDRFHRNDKVIEIILAITASSSAVAGLFLWKTELGLLAWKGLTSLSAVVSVLKPILDYRNKIVRAGEVLSKYKMIFYDLDILRISIKEENCYNATMMEEFKKINLREKDLASKHHEENEDGKLKGKCVDEVLKRYPPDYFYVPSGE